MRPLSILAALALLAAGCSEPLTTGCDSADPDCFEHEVVAGVDFTALFRTPTTEDVAAVTDTWTRNGTPRTVEAIAERDLGGRELVTILRGDDATGANQFVGAIRQPPRDPGDQRLRPLFVFVPDGADVDLSEVIANLPIREDVRDEVVLLVMARRGGSLHVGDETFTTSSADADPLGTGAALDVLALVDYARSQADRLRIAADRVGFSGHGTGGHTVLLAGARSSVDDYLFSLAAPSTFFTLGVREAARLYLRGQPFNGFPGLTATFDRLLAPVRDGALTVEAARDSLIARSPALVEFPPSPPAAFLFGIHGERDLVVPDEQGRALVPVIRETGGLSLILPEGGHDTVLQDFQVLSTGFSFLCATLLAGQTYCS